MNISVILNVFFEIPFSGSKSAFVVLAKVNQNLENEDHVRISPLLPQRTFWHRGVGVMLTHMLADVGILNS